MDMVDQVMQIDPVQALILVSVGAGVVVGVDKLAGSVASLKERFVDRKANRIIDAQLKGDEALREEIMATFKEYKADHEKYETWFARDNRRIGKLEDEIEEMRDDVARAHERIDDRAEESTIIMKSMKSMLSHMLGLTDDSEIKASVNEIDQYLIERREK